MRTFFHSAFMSFFSFALAWSVSLSTFVCDLADRTVQFLREAFNWSAPFILRLAALPRLVRHIGMGATALNQRDLGGVRCRGDLGLPAVRILTG